MHLWCKGANFPNFFLINTENTAVLFWPSRVYVEVLKPACLSRMVTDKNTDVGLLVMLHDIPIKLEGDPLTLRSKVRSSHRSVPKLT